MARVSQQMPFPKTISLLYYAVILICIVSLPYNEIFRNPHTHFSIKNKFHISHLMAAFLIVALYILSTQHLICI